MTTLFIFFGKFPEQAKKYIEEQSTLVLKGEIEMIGPNVTNELFPQHLLDAFKEQVVENVIEAERRDFEKGIEFEGVNK